MLRFMACLIGFHRVERSSIEKRDGSVFGRCRDCGRGLEKPMRDGPWIASAAGDSTGSLKRAAI